MTEYTSEDIRAAFDEQIAAVVEKAILAHRARSVKPVTVTGMLVASEDAPELARAVNGIAIKLQPTAVDPADKRIAETGARGMQAAALKALYSTAPPPAPAESPLAAAGRAALGKS